ncbi:MAG: RusA family crossover junction endodeoxyribonuclease [Thermomicrobiales bacterium]
MSEPVMSASVWDEPAREPDHEFFIAQHPRVGGFSGRQRSRRDRYLKPILEQLSHPLPRHSRLSVEYRFVFISPEYDMSGRNRLLRTDVDNLLKFVNDLLTGVVWEDDSQIFELRATKRHGPESGIGLRVWIFDDDEEKGGGAS